MTASDWIQLGLGVAGLVRELVALGRAGGDPLAVVEDLRPRLAEIRARRETTRSTTAPSKGP